MKKSFLIARSNLRKAKGQTAAIAVLIVAAALMLNLWLMLSMDYHANFDRYHDKLNAEHVTLAVDNDSGGFREFLSQTLGGDGRVSEYRFDSCMHMAGAFPYNGGEVTSEFVFLEKETALMRSVGRTEIIEDGGGDSGIYLPMLYKSDKNAIGRKITVSIGSSAVEYTICGFFNSVMMGSHNCVLTEMILTEDKYEELEELGCAPKATLCSIRLDKKSESLKYEADIKTAVSEYLPNVRMAGNCYDIVSQSRYISQMICSGILSAMAFFVLLIALVVIVTNIIHYVQVNIKNLGALKAAGYTSGQLVSPLLLQFLGLAFLASAAGAGLSYCLFPTVNAMMISQTGIPYTVHFLPLPLIISFLILEGAAAASVWLATRRIKKIEPVTALRSGVRTHSFKKNHIPLEKTRAPLHFALALKTTLSGVKHNITVCITMLVLSLVVVFSGLMTENVIADTTSFLNLIVGEAADSCINVQTEVEEDFLREAGKDSRVEKVYLYSSLDVSHAGGAELMATLCDDFSKANNQNVVYEGRFPRYDNEIAVAARYAGEKGLEIGNEIEITANGKKETYLICGFTQISNNLGRDCLLTRQGYERLGELANASYYINLSEGTDIDEFHDEMKGTFGRYINEAINQKALLDGTGGVYVTLMKIIVAAILVLSAVIIAFVMYLLVRTMLGSKMRDYGIMKSLGFTTGQLILQTALSFMPSVLLSAAAGLILSSLIINPLTALFLKGIGIVKCTFTVPAGFIAAAGAGLVLLAFVTACLLSLKIRKITPRVLLSGE